MNEERNQRIRAMEQALNASTGAVERMKTALDELETVLPQLEQLNRYYQSELWMQDYDADEAGQLPPDLRRGVLAQDTLYDFLEECGRLKLRMEGSAERLKNAL